MNKASKEKPYFVKDQRPNPVWGKMIGTHGARLEITIKKILKGESKSCNAIYWYLRHVDQQGLGFAYPSQDTIARRVSVYRDKVSTKGVARKTVTRCIKRLVEIGLLFVLTKDRHNIYVFTLPPSWQKYKMPLENAIAKVEEAVEEAGVITLKSEQEKAMSLDFVPSKCPSNIIQNIKRKEKTPKPKKIEQPQSQKNLQGDPKPKETEVVTIPFNTPKAIQEIFIADFLKKGVKYEVLTDNAGGII